MVLIYLKESSLSAPNDSFLARIDAPEARVAELVDARDLRLFWAPRLETLGVNGVKFGETSARRGGGNPELIPG